MTAPAPAQQPQSPQQQALEDAAIVAGLAVLLATLTPSVSNIVALLTRPPARRGEIRVTPKAARAAAGIVLHWGQPTTAPHGEAGRLMQRLNVQRRAQYLLAAGRRITRDVLADSSRDGLVAAIGRERRYWQQHLEASTRRELAGAAVDTAADQHGELRVTGHGKVGTVLGWHAILDSRTDPACRAAHGKNFILERPPRIGLPGTVHPACRCVAVPPYRTRQLVGGGLLPNKPR